jgi:hypothetical protein
MRGTTCYTRPFERAPLRALPAYSVRFNRQNIGVVLLAVSVLSNGLALSGRFRPMSLRMSAHGGLEHALAIALGSLSLKAVVLAVGAVLAFWPVNRKT